MSGPITVLKSRVKITAAPQPPAIVRDAPPKRAGSAAKPLLRFITKGFYKSEDANALVHQLRALDWRESEDTQRGELVRLFRGHARVSIRINGYVFAGGAGGDALDQLDQLSRGVK